VALLKAVDRACRDQQRASVGLQPSFGICDLDGEHDPLDTLTDLSVSSSAKGTQWGPPPDTSTWSTGLGRSVKKRMSVRVIEVERRDVRIELEADSMQPVWVAGGQDDGGSLLMSASGGLQFDARGSAEHHNRLAREPLLPGAGRSHAVSPVRTLVEWVRSVCDSPREPRIAPSSISASRV
jgi:hypothetical protein